MGLSDVAFDAAFGGKKTSGQMDGEAAERTATKGEEKRG